MCSDVTVNGQPIACVGDDSLHKVLYGAYTWRRSRGLRRQRDSLPSHLQSEVGFRAEFADYPSVPEFPLCSDMPDNYKPKQTPPAAVSP